MINLNDLGERICIIGPSASGKSTLARELGNKLNIEVCFLDQMAHLPSTNWVRKPNHDFQNEHQQFLLENQQWIMEGNYSFLMKDRFAQATSVIFLDYYGLDNLVRYLRRSCASSATRPGHLQGASSSWSWRHIKYMLIKAPQYRVIYRRFILQSGVPVLYISSFNELKKYYQHWGL